MGKIGTSTVKIEEWYELLKGIDKLGVENLEDLRDYLAEIDPRRSMNHTIKGAYEPVSNLKKIFDLHEIDINLGLQKPINSRTVGIATLTEYLNPATIKSALYNIGKLNDRLSSGTLALLPPSAFDRNYRVYPLSETCGNYSKMGKFYTDGDFCLIPDKHQICSADNYDWMVYSEVKVEKGQIPTYEAHIVISNFEFDIDKMPIYGEYTSTTELPEVELIAVPGDGTWKAIEPRYVLSKFYKGKITNR